MNANTSISSGIRMAPAPMNGYQTVQQAIYNVHHNPCGLNTLIFQKMGLTQLRYIDLKIYLDHILNSTEMTSLFENVRKTGTEYIYSRDELKQTDFLHALSLWAQAGLRNLPIPIDQYPGYTIRFSVYDYSGCTIWDSKVPNLTITFTNLGGTVFITSLILFWNPQGEPAVQLYQLANNPALIAYVDSYESEGFDATHSSFVVNQIALPESVMAISSLLVDSANTRTFGIPRYGFSARTSSNAGAGIGYHCTNFIDINTIADNERETTLIMSIMARISIEENSS